MAEIGIKLADGAFYPVLPDESQQRKRLVLGAAQPSEGSVHIDLLRRDGDEETYIGSLALQDLDPTQDVEFELRMEIDANGDLDVFVHDSGRTQYQSLSIPLRDLENPAVSSPFGDDDADDEGFSQFFPEETLEDSSDFESESETDLEADPDSDPEPELDDSDISDFDLDQELLDDDDPPEAEAAPIDIGEITLDEDELELGESFDEPPLAQDAQDDAEATEDDEIDLDSFVLGGDLDADLDSSIPSNLDLDDDFDIDGGTDDDLGDELDGNLDDELDDELDGNLSDDLDDDLIGDLGDDLGADVGDKPGDVEEQSDALAAPTEEDFDLDDDLTDELETDTDSDEQFNDFTDELDDDFPTEPAASKPEADTYTDTYSLDNVEDVEDTDTFEDQDEDEEEPPAPTRREKRKKEKASKKSKAEPKAPSRSYANTPASHRPVNPVVMAALILVVVSLLALGAWLVLLLQNAQIMPELRASYIIPMVCVPHRWQRRRTR